MQVRPIRTLPLRLSLRLQRLRNRQEKKHQASAASRLLDVKHTIRHESVDSAVLTAKVHPYAGIGHQLSAWISGYLWAGDLKLPYRADTLSRNGSGLFDFSASEAPEDRTPAVRVRLRATRNERDLTSLKILAAQISHKHGSRRKRNVEFRLSLDQARWDQIPAQGAVRRAVLDGAKGNVLLAREQGAPYAAIHVRRGDVIAATHPDRWLTQEWYKAVIEKLREAPSFQNLPIRVYSLGSPRDFVQLAELDGVSIHLNGERDDDFIDMCAARLLVTAPSSFSFTAALAGRGAVLARVPWWHHVPNEDRWAHISEDGSVDVDDVERALAYATSRKSSA